MLAAGLLWAYWPTLADMAERWSSDPRYSHGYVVPLFAAVVLWVRRPEHAAVRYRPCFGGVPLLGAAALLHVAGAYAYFNWLDALSVLPAAAGACVLLGAWPALRWAWPGVALLAFMLPWPYAMEVALAQPLQRIATLASTYCMQTCGLPALSEGNVILLDDVEIGVVEACSGLGMLVTFFALSTAAAFVVRRPLRDRLILFVSAAPIAVAANVARISVTGVLFHTASSAVARVVYHDLAGWLMMPLAVGLLWLEVKFLERLFVLEPDTGPVPFDYARQPVPHPPTVVRRKDERKPKRLAAAS